MLAVLRRDALPALVVALTKTDFDRVAPLLDRPEAVVFDVITTP